MALLALAAVLTGCHARVSVDPIEIKPIELTINVNYRRAADDQPAAPQASQYPAAASVPTPTE